MDTMQELLQILEKNARLSLENIAAMMDLPTEQVAAMMDEANEKGYIHGYQALVDWEKAGVNQVEAMIELHVSPARTAASRRLPPPLPPSRRWIPSC